MSSCCCSPHVLEYSLGQFLGILLNVKQGEGITGVTLCCGEFIELFNYKPQCDQARTMVSPYCNYLKACAGPDVALIITAVLSLC